MAFTKWSKNKEERLAQLKAHNLEKRRRRPKRPRGRKLHPDKIRRRVHITMDKVVYDLIDELYPEWAKSFRKKTIASSKTRMIEEALSMGLEIIRYRQTPK